MVAASYSTTQVARAAGVTYRQLDYWARHGIVTPSIADATGCGSRRRWSADDVARVKRIGEVARKRVRLVYGLDDTT